MTQAAEISDTTPSTHPLIECNRVEGTLVYSPHGQHVGTIHHLIIEKVRGRVVYAVMSFGGFLGIGSKEHTIPWEKLKYDPSLAASAPTSRQRNSPGLAWPPRMRRTGRTAGGSRTYMTTGRCRPTEAGEQLGSKPSRPRAANSAHQPQ